MPDIEILLDSVKKAITNFSNTLYPSFYKELKKVNTIFGKLNKYWSGKRYRETMKAWNTAVPQLNKYLETIVSSSKISSGIFKNYTEADGNPVTIKPASLIKLNQQSINDKPGRTNFDSSMLIQDLSDIKTSLTFSKDYANKMNDAIRKAEWKDSGGAIDTSKQDITRALTMISGNLATLLSEINVSLTEIEQGFSTAKKSYKK